MGEKIGILLYENRSFRRWYFFCLTCSQHFTRSDIYHIFPVYEGQFPEPWGQKCHTFGCAKNLKDGASLFEQHSEIEVPEDLGVGPQIQNQPRYDVYAEFNLSSVTFQRNSAVYRR